MGSSKITPKPNRHERRNQHRLLGDGDSPGGPLPATTSLGFARFFFLLFKPMLRMGGNPAIRQKSIKGSGVADLGGVRGEAVTQSDSGCDRWLHRLASRAGGATSCGLPHAKRSGQCGAEVD